MKRIAFMAALLISVSLLVFSQMSCQPAANTNAPETAAANTNSGRETVNTAAIESELLRIENDWPRVLKEKDVEAVRRIEADDLVIVYPDGKLGNKEQDINNIQTGALSADSWEVADLKILVLDNDAAVASGRSIVKGGKYKGADGKVIDISGQYRFVDTFARRNGQWKLVASAGAPFREPVGEGSPAAKASPTVSASPMPRVSPSPRISPTTTPPRP
ncbi:MAG: nuclear transport factor 2 family protein [Pyrinomonadaceae bacterium]